MTNLSRLVKKAGKSQCRYRVSAMAFNRRGDMIGLSSNQPRFRRLGGSLHAEAALMKSLGGIHTIVICRIGVGGALLPIEPCPNCQKLADKLGIRITSVLEGGRNG